jgi:hypothetical protein
MVDLAIPSLNADQVVAKVVEDVRDATCGVRIRL